MSMRCGLQTLLEAARFVELQEEFEKQQLVTLHAAGNYCVQLILYIILLCSPRYVKILNIVVTQYIVMTHVVFIFNNI